MYPTKSHARCMAQAAAVQFALTKRSHSNSPCAFLMGCHTMSCHVMPCSAMSFHSQWCASQSGAGLIYCTYGTLMGRVMHASKWSYVSRSISICVSSGVGDSDSCPPPSDYFPPATGHRLPPTADCRLPSASCLCAEMFHANEGVGLRIDSC